MLINDPNSLPGDLDRHGVELTRDETTTLQVNVGLACDLTCRHCHLEAGPARTELMDGETVGSVIAYAERIRFASVDITGGAPELLPQLPYLVERLAPLTPRLIVRTNLTALARPESAALPERYLQKLAESFNPCTLPGLMCRTLISVDWIGFLYDCDFNLAVGLHHGAHKLHISHLTTLPAPGTPIPVGDHCYSCTAGSGFT